MFKSGSDRKLIRHIFLGAFLCVIFDLIVIKTTFSITEKYVFVGLYSLYYVYTICYMIPYLYIDRMKDSKRKVKPEYKKYDLRLPIYYVGDNRSYARKICKVYKTLNEEDRAVFEKKGFYIVVCSHSDFEKFSKNMNGYFSPKYRHILLFTDAYIAFTNGFNSSSGVSKYVYAGKSGYEFYGNFYHEWGHFLDFKYCYKSNTKEFLKHYYKTKSNYVHDCVGFGRLNSPKTEFGRLFLMARSWKDPYIYEYTTPKEYFATEYSRYKLGSGFYDKKLTSFFEGL